MRRLVRSILTAGMLAGLVFLPGAVAPSSPKAAKDCGPNPQLSAQAKKVTKLAPGVYDYELASVAILPHDDAPMSPESPWTPTAVNGRKYRYVAEGHIKHWTSDPCNLSDTYQYWGIADCQRMNVSTGAIAAGSPCAFDVRLATQTLVGGIWQTQGGGWIWYSANFHSTCETAGAPQITVPDGTWVRGVIFVDTIFYHYPDWTTNQPANARWGSTPRLQVFGTTHNVESTTLWPGFYDTSETGPGPLIDAGGCL